MRFGVVLAIGTASCLGGPTEKASERLAPNELFSVNGERKLWGSYVRPGPPSVGGTPTGITEVRIGPCDLRIRTYLDTYGFDNEDTWRTGHYWAWSTQPAGPASRGVIEHQVEKVIVNGQDSPFLPRTEAYLFELGTDPGLQTPTLRLTPREGLEEVSFLVKNGNSYSPTPDERWCLDGDDPPRSSTGGRKQPFDHSMREWRQLQPQNVPSLVGAYTGTWWNDGVASVSIGACEVDITGAVQHEHTEYTWIPHGPRGDGFLVMPAGIWMVMSGHSWSSWAPTTWAGGRPLLTLSTPDRGPMRVWRDQARPIAANEWQTCFPGAAPSAMSLDFGDPLIATLPPSGSIDFSLTVGSARPYRIEVEPVSTTSPPMDVAVEIRAPDGSTVAPQSGEETGGRGTYRFGAAGFYTVTVRGVASPPGTEFTIRANPLLEVPSTVNEIESQTFALVARAGETYQLTALGIQYLEAEGAGVEGWKTYDDRDPTAPIVLTFKAREAGRILVFARQSGSDARPFTLSVSRLGEQGR